MSFIIYQCENSTQCTFVYPTGEVPIDVLANQVVPTGQPYTIVDSIDIDYDFITAYDYSDNGPIFNVQRGQEIQRNNWRAARLPLLQQLDVTFMRSVEQGDQELQLTIAKQKQLLRDVTTHPLSDNLEEIRSCWPDILGPLVS